jgi:hypothetical protein
MKSVRAFFLGVAMLAAAPMASAQVAPSARVQAVVEALSTGEAATYEAAAQANFSPAMLARRDPAQRAELAQRIHGDFGQLTITSQTADGATIRAEVSGASGTTGAFTFTFTDTPEHLIDALRIEAGGH